MASVQKPGRPFSDDSADRQDAILHAAIALVSQGGFNAASIREIAARAGVSPGLVRHYYGSKRELISACNTAVMSQVSQIFEQLFASSEDLSFDESVERMIGEMIELVSPKIQYFKYLGQLFLRDDKESRESFKIYFETIGKFTDDLAELSGEDKARDRTWATFQVIFLQLGPVLLSSQIASIIGRDAFDEKVIEARVSSMGRMLKSGIRDA